MPHGDIAGQLIQVLPSEYLGDQPSSFLALHPEPVTDRYAAAFLPAVLQRVQSII